MGLSVVARPCLTEVLLARYDVWAGLYLRNTLNLSVATLFL